MENVDIFANLISNQGFPIAVCIAGFVYLNKLTSTHKEEIDSLKNVLENNTLVLAQLKEMLNNVLSSKRD